MAEPANMPNAARTAARQAHLAEIAAAERNALPGWTDGIISRARWVRDHNDGEPKPVWSTGEKIIVALVLGNDRYLDDADYTARKPACDWSATCTAATSTPGLPRCDWPFSRVPLNAISGARARESARLSGSPGGGRSSCFRDSVLVRDRRAWDRLPADVAEVYAERADDVQHGEPAWLGNRAGLDLADRGGGQPRPDRQLLLGQARLLSACAKPRRETAGAFGVAAISAFPPSGRGHADIVALNIYR